MAEREQHKYGADDIERYYSDKMTPAEMNALEKAALDDIFLADALEGYSRAKSIIRDNNDLKSRLLNKTNRNKSKLVRLFFSTGFKVAAIFVVFGALCWVLYNNTTHRDDISMNTPVVVSKKNPVSSILPTDTVPGENQDTLHLKNLKTENDIAKTDASVTRSAHQGYTVTTVKNEKPLQAASGDKNQQSGISTRTLEQAKNSKFVQTKMPVANATETRTLKGRITDLHGEPVPFATVTDKNTSQATSADNEGAFSLVIKDSTPLIAVSALGFETYTRKINADSANHDIVLMEAGASGEVASAKENKQTVTLVPAKQMTNRLDSEHRVTLINAVPVNGWQLYNQYISKKLKNRQQLAAGENAIEINVSFNVNSKGEMKDIAPVNSSCKPCVDEAVNTLSGARYTLKVKNAKATAVVRF